MFRDLDIIVDNSIPDANEITKALVLNNAKFENPKFIISNEKHNFLIPVSPSWLTDSLICRRMFPLSFYSNYIESTFTYPLFLLNIEIFIDKSIPSFEYIDSLLLAGAILVDSPSKNCIHVSNHVLNIDCKLANANWIKKILSQRRFIDPKKSILTYPIPKDPIPGFNELLICVSGYVKNRDMIEYMVVKGGAKFTRVLSKSCSHLITKSMASEKYTRALSWNVHTVNHLWLEDSFEKWERQCEGRVSYLHFVPALDDIVGDLIVSDARDLDFKSKAEFFAIKTNDNEKELPIFSDVRDVVLKSKPENVEIQSNDIQMELPIFDVSDTRDGALKNKTELVEIQSKDELPVQDDLPIFIKETISKDDGNKDTNMQSEMISPVSNIKTEPIIKESNKADRKESKRSKKAVEPQAIKKLREKTIIINQEVKAEVNLKVKEIKEAERTSPINETLPVNRKRASSVQEADPKKQKIISESVNQLKTQISDSQVDQLEETPTIKPTTRSKSMLNSNIIVVLTGCRLTEKQQEALKTIGISLTDDIKQATHLVADRIKRTEKMLNAIRENLVINSFEWLIDCISKKKIVVDKILRDTEHEELFGMTLESSLANSSRNPKPLQGISVFIDGKSAVDQVLKRLVVKAGGTLKKGGIVADTEVLLNCFLRWEFDDLL